MRARTGTLAFVAILAVLPASSATAQAGADSVWIDAEGNVRPIPPLNIRWRREEI